MYELTKKLGKPICVALYALGAYNAAKKKPASLAILAGCHLCEYIFVARKVGKEHSIGQLETFANCLAFGFTWWLPIKKG